MSYLEFITSLAIASGVAFTTMQMSDLAMSNVDQFNQQQLDYVKGLTSEKITCPISQ